MLAAVSALLASAVALTPVGASAETIPGPPARPGQEPVGGPLLARTGVILHPLQPAGVTPPPVAADSWLVADVGTGQVLAAKDPHGRFRPASTLKTLTALSLMPRLDPAKVYRATDADARADGGHVGIVPGASYTVNDLWHGLLLPSGNDAASALANAYGGFPKTIALLNAEALRLQAFDTVARTPSGLDADGQWSSAYDLALIARQTLAMPEFVTVSGSLSYDFPGKMPAKAGQKRPTFKIFGQNRLLKHGFAGTIAGKTGYTTQARRTFWVAVSRGGTTLVATLMRIGEPTEAAAEKLITWGFANAAKVRPVGTLVDPVDPDASNASGPAADPFTGQVDVEGNAGGGPDETPRVVAGGPNAATGGSVPVGALVVGLGGAVVVAGGALLFVRRPRRRQDGLQALGAALGRNDAPTS